LWDSNDDENGGLQEDEDNNEYNLDETGSRSSGKATYDALKRSPIKTRKYFPETWLWEMVLVR